MVLSFWALRIKFLMLLINQKLSIFKTIIVKFNKLTTHIYMGLNNSIKNT